MNSIPLALDLLEGQISMAYQANTDFEKAAVFAATITLVKDLEAEIGETNPYALENLERARWHTCAIVGYDVDNGHDASMHRSWASSAVKTLRDLLIK